MIIALFLPFITFLITSIFGRYIGRAGCSIIIPTAMGLSCILFIFLGIPKVCTGNSEIIYFNEWLLYGVDWGFLFDNISIEMAILITTITTCVLIYSTEYMYHDPHIIRFLGYLTLFGFFMLILVTANNLIQMFIGWEGVGFVSFLLINFWFMRLEANRSAIKAVLFNRIGDSFFLLGIALSLIYIKTTDFLILNNIKILNPEFAPTIILFGNEFNFYNILLLCFFMAAVGKSAQLGLHAWLPDAMEGPTPVSSLLHSATMVTAGVFLLIRISPIVPYTNIVSYLIWIGALTAMLNAIFGFFQKDLKKIIAFSTCSQLGMMVVGVLYSPQYGFYHLMNHGFFKALLFLSAGSIIHALDNEQDIRKMGGLAHSLPFTFLCMLFGCFALVGFPFLSGFYSKELILFTTLNSGYFFDNIIFLMLIITSIFTGFYSIKILIYVFIKDFFGGPRKVLANVHEAPKRMAIPMLVLVILSMIFGFFNEEIFSILNSDNWSTFNNVQDLNILFGLETIKASLKLFLIYFFLLLLKKINKKYYIYEGMKTRFRKKKNTYFFHSNFSKVLVYSFWALSNKLGFISLYRKLTTNALYIGYKVTYELLDRGVFELFGPTQVVRVLLKHKKNILNSQFSISLVSLISNFFYFTLFLIAFLFIDFYILVFIIILVHLLKILNKNLTLNDNENTVANNKTEEK